MTSPAQLKYLQAMGIPVWVSRELVHEEIAEPDFKNDDITKNVAVSNAVSNILQDLDTQEIQHPEVKEKLTGDLPNKSAAPKNDLSAHAGHNLLAQTEQHNIYACGSLDARWLVIGESPEFINDDNDQPFAEDSGELLINMLKAVGIENPRSEAYLVNVLERTQQKSINLHAVAELHKLLEKMTHQIKPKILLVVGQRAAQNILQTKEPLARLRGKEHRLPETDIPVVVTYYPSYLVSKPMDKRKAWEDLKLAMSLIE